MLKQRITEAVKSILNSDFGFDIYIVMKSGDSLLKRFILEEGNPNEQGGFKNRICESIKDTIQNKFLSEESLYAGEDDLANEQNRFYVIRQNEQYRPFEFLDIPENQLQNFRFTDKDNADAILFKFTFQRNGEIKQLWAYQKIQPSSIPNKQKKHFQFIIKSQDRPDIFMEMKDQMFMITKSVDLLVVGDEIITDQIGFMERHFGLETFVRTSAERAVSEITTVQLVENESKLLEYVQRRNKKYAKKMMQIHKFPVAGMNKTSLMAKLNSVDRWRDVFEIREDQIHLRTFKDVENLIDLFVERYTRSDVTGQEYDTSVKDKAEPVSNDRQQQ